MSILTSGEVPIAQHVLYLFPVHRDLLVFGLALALDHRSHSHKNGKNNLFMRYPKIPGDFGWFWLALKRLLQLEQRPSLEQTVQSDRRPEPRPPRSDWQPVCRHWISIYGLIARSTYTAGVLVACRSREPRKMWEIDWKHQPSIPLDIISEFPDRDTPYTRSSMFLPRSQCADSSSLPRIVYSRNIYSPTLVFNLQALPPISYYQFIFFYHHQIFFIFAVSPTKYIKQRFNPANIPSRGKYGLLSAEFGVVPGRLSSPVSAKGMTEGPRTEKYPRFTDSYD